MSGGTEGGDALSLLRGRGYVQDVTDEDGLRDLLTSGPTTFYVGFDPSAPSLHLGNLVGVMAMAWLQRAGHRPIAIVGGATGRIGDPSGRDDERDLLDEATIDRNLGIFRSQLSRFLDLSAPDRGMVLDNHDWLSRFGFLGFLRDVGKHFSVNQMIARESVRRRLEEREQGISFTEFSYQLLQAYDFAHLYATEGCRLQGGGSDQWGNIVAGVELTRRLHGAEVYGLTWPLLLDAEGRKFGKSVGQPVWLDPEMTSPYAYYQWWLNRHDDDAVRFLRLFTFLDDTEIEGLAAAHARDPAGRLAHRRLAEEATRIAHGAAGLAEAQRATAAAFGNGGATGSPGLPTVDVPRDRLEGGVGLLALLVEAGAASSNSEARRLVEQGGVYLNDERLTDPAAQVTAADAREGVLVLRVGKKRHHAVRLV